MAHSVLLDELSNEFGNDAVNRIATTIGESPGKIKAALGDMLPVLLGGIASKAETDEGAHELLDVIHRDQLDTERYDHVADAIREPGSLGSLMNKGEPLLDSVLPGKSDVVSDWIASHSGINPSSSKSLMGMALALVLGLIGRRVGSSGESGLKSLLGKPTGFLEDAPAGLAGLVGGAGTSARNVHARHGAQQGRRKASDATPKSIWIWPLLLLLAIIALMWYYTGNRDTEQVLPPASNAASGPPLALPATPAAPMEGGETGGFIERQLADGTTMRIPRNGVEDRLLAFIEDESQPVSDSVWFTFDRLAFESNSAALTPSSTEQLRNIADIMQAYPGVQLKIGGYTDNSGDPQRNVQLSGERATSAMNQIAALGVDASRMRAEGYGDQHPVADNSTEEGRQKNRRVDVNVTAK